MKILSCNKYDEQKIYELIKRTRENDYFSFQELLNIFNNKLISSAREINSSDAYETLLSKFMECIIKMPLDETLKNHTLINYIYSSIKKCKIRAIYETHNLVNFTDKTYIYDLSNDLISIDEYNDEFYYIINELNQREKDILSLYYKYKFTEQEIGDRLHISKQAVSKRKKKSLSKLRHFLS